MSEAIMLHRRKSINYAKDWEFTVNSTHALVTKYIGNKTDVNVPAKIKGKPVVLNASTDSSTGVFTNNQNITSINIPENVTMSTSYASNFFYNCVNLKSVNRLPVDASGRISGINYAFTNCYNLSEPPEISGSNLFNYAYAFANCYNLKNTISNGVATSSYQYMQYAYYDCRNITSVTLPNFAQNLAYTFYNCANLTSIQNPNNATVYNQAYMCYNCYKLPEINMIHHGNLAYTYYNCTNLKTINTTSLGSPNSMDHTYYNCTNLLKINDKVLPSGLTSFNYTFYNCKKATGSTPNMHDAVNLFHTFDGCENLTTINDFNVYHPLENMSYAFRNCKNITVPPILPLNVKNMAYAFTNCYNLTKPSAIPPNVVNVSNCYSYCTNITGNVYIRSPLISNAGIRNMFYGTTSTKNVYIYYRHFENTANSKTYNSSIANNTYGINGKNGCTVKNTLINGEFYGKFNGTINSVVSSGRRINYFTGDCRDSWIPSVYNGVRVLISSFINESAPSSVYLNLSKIHFNGLMDIGGLNFQNLSNLTDITGIMGAANTSIVAGEILANAFGGCNNLTSIEDIYNINIANAFANHPTLNKVNSVVTDCYANNAFRNCKNLTSINSINISNSSVYTFYNCQKLKNIGEFVKLGNNAAYAFYNCRNIKTINAVQISEGNAPYIFAHCVNLTKINHIGGGEDSSTQPVIYNFTNAFFNCQKLTGTINIVGFKTGLAVSSAFNNIFYNTNLAKSVYVTSYNFRKASYNMYHVSSNISGKNGVTVYRNARCNNWTNINASV